MDEVSGAVKIESQEGHAPAKHMKSGLALRYTTRRIVIEDKQSAISPMLASLLSYLGIEPESFRIMQAL